MTLSDPKWPQMTLESYTVFDFVDLPFTKQKSSLNLSCAVKACEYR